MGDFPLTLVIIVLMYVDVLSCKANLWMFLVSLYTCMGNMSWVIFGIWFQVYFRVWKNDPWCVCSFEFARSSLDHPLEVHACPYAMFPVKRYWGIVIVGLPFILYIMLPSIHYGCPLDIHVEYGMLGSVAFFFFMKMYSYTTETVQRKAPQHASQYNVKWSCLERWRDLGVMCIGYRVVSIRNASRN